MNRIASLSLSACLFAGLGGLQRLSADVITEYNRATFAAALGGGTVSGQNFEGIPANTVITTIDGVTYIASLGSAFVTNHFLTTTPPNGLGSTSAGFFEGNEAALISFGSSITGFGIDINTFAPTAGDYLATLSDGATVLSKFDVFPGTATGQFIGFIDNVPITSVTISAIRDPNGTQYPYTLDSLVYGSAGAISQAATPEPSTFGLLSIGLVLFASLRHRRLGGLAGGRLDRLNGKKQSLGQCK